MRVGGILFLLICLSAYGQRSSENALRVTVTPRNAVAIAGQAAKLHWVIDPMPARGRRSGNQRDVKAGNVCGIGRGEGPQAELPGVVHGEESRGLQPSAGPHPNAGGTPERG